MTEQTLLEQATKIRDTICKRHHFSDTFKEHLPELERVKILKHGNFTTVVLNKEFVGVTKRNPTDKDKPNVGVTIALHRAVKDLLCMTT